MKNRKIQNNPQKPPAENLPSSPQNDEYPVDARFDALFREFLEMESRAPAVLDARQRLKS